MPNVRTSVHGPKMTGRSPFNALCHVGRKGWLLRLASWCIEQKHWKNPFSAQVRSHGTPGQVDEPGAPVQFLMGSVRGVIRRVGPSVCCQLSQHVLQEATVLGVENFLRRVDAPLP